MANAVHSELIRHCVSVITELQCKYLQVRHSTQSVHDGRHLLWQVEADEKIVVEVVVSDNLGCIV